MHSALCDADLARAGDLLRGGANINAYTEYGESLLDDIVHRIEDDSRRREVVQFMLANGADARFLTKDGSGPLFAAVIQKDTEVLRMLLDYGADPNKEHDMGEPLYDWAAFDYAWDEYECEYPEEPTDDETATKDGWLRFFDRLAIKYGKRRPDYLLLLRERGALSYDEQQAAKAKTSENR